MPVIYDELGTIIGVVPGEGRSHVGLVDDTIDNTFGGKMWRFFHPGTEKAENQGTAPGDRNTAELPPEVTIGDLYEAGATELRTGGAVVYNESKSLITIVVIGMVAYFGIQLMDRMPSNGSVRRKVQHYRKRAAHAVSRRIAG